MFIIFKGVFRALKPGGRYFNFSHGLPNTRINYFKNKIFKWNVEVYEFSKKTS